MDTLNLSPPLVLRLPSVVTAWIRKYASWRTVASRRPSPTTWLSVALVSIFGLLSKRTNPSIASGASCSSSPTSTPAASWSLRRSLTACSWKRPIASSTRICSCMLVCTVVLAFRTSAIDRLRDQRSPAPLMVSKISCAADGAPVLRIFWTSATSLFSMAPTAGKMAVLHGLSKGAGRGRAFGLRKVSMQKI